jgi:hypothetical protein
MVPFESRITMFPVLIAGLYITLKIIVVRENKIK